MGQWFKKTGDNTDKKETEDKKKQKLKSTNLHSFIKSFDLHCLPAIVEENVWQQLYEWRLSVGHEIFAIIIRTKDGNVWNSRIPDNLREQLPRLLAKKMHGFD